MAAIGLAEQIVVQGYVVSEVDGHAIRVPDTSEDADEGATVVAPVVSEPVGYGTQANLPTLFDAVSHRHIWTQPRRTTPNAADGYYALLALATNDPDVTAYGGRKITLPDGTIRTIQIPYNAQQTTVTTAMAAQTGLIPGDQVRAIWFGDAADFTVPAPTGPPAIYTAAQIDSLLAGFAAPAWSAIQNKPDFPELIRDSIAAALVAGANVTVVPDDAGDTITISAPLPTALVDERARDAVAAMIAAGTHSGIVFAYDDAGDALSATVTGGGGGSGGTSYVPTVNKTVANSPVTAAAGDLVMVDASGGAVTVNAPASGTFGVKKLDATPNAVTVVRAGTDTIGSQASTTFPIRTNDQATYFTKNPNQPANWVVTHNHLSLAALDARYRQFAVYDDVTAVADGTLAGRISTSGHTWLAQSDGQGGSAAPVILGGAIGPPAGFTPGGTGSTAAGYAYLQPGGTVGWVGGQLRFDASDSVASSVALGAFTQTGITTTTGGANMHCAITPYGLQFGVFTAGTNELVASGYLVPDGYDTNNPRFPLPLPCDGTTVTRVDIAIDKARARAYVTVGDFPTLTFTDPRIRTVEATYAFWEYYSVTGGSNLPRFLRVWTDPASAATVAPQAPLLASMAAGATPSGRGGGGGAAVRPCSRMRNGSIWYESGFATTLSAAANSGATSVSVPIPVPAGTTIAIDDADIYKRELRTVTAVSGTGPYTLTVAALGVTHASGATVTGGQKQTFSDGKFWRDPTGLVVGNRLDPGIVTAAENANSVFVATGTVTTTRVRAPSSAWRTPSVYRSVAGATGDFSIYVAGCPVEAGAPFFSATGQVLCATTARAIRTTARWYNTTPAQVGADVDSASQTVATTGNPAAFVTAATLVPSGASIGLWLLKVTGAVSGDVFYWTDPCVAPGPVPAQLRT